MRRDPASSTDRQPIRISWEDAATPQTKLKQRVATPFSAEEIEALDRVARRLHAELRDVIALLPAQSRSASGMARYLEIDRTTCHRLVSAVMGAYQGPVVLTKLPGVRGLRHWLDACLSHGLDRALLDPADAAIERFAEAIQRVGGSQSKLARRLSSQRVADASAGGVVGDTGDRLREHLFESGCAITGQHTDVSIATFVFRHSSDNPDLIDSGQLRCFSGHHMRASAMPFSFMWWGRALDEAGTRSGLFKTLDENPVRGQTDGVLLEQFSSDPLPKLTARGTTERQVLIVDPDGRGQTPPFTITTANRTIGAHTHPRLGTPPVHEVWMLGRLPARYLIFDVFLHRSLAMSCIPSVGVYAVSPDLNETASQRWLDRYPNGPTLSILPPGLVGADHNACPRYREMLGFFFDRLGWDADEFVGHRCALAYPQWSAGYCMSFDYGPPGGGADAV